MTQEQKLRQAITAIQKTWNDLQPIVEENAKKYTVDKRDIYGALSTRCMIAYENKTVDGIWERE